MEEDIIKLVISNKINKDVEYNKIIFHLKENNNKAILSNRKVY